MPGGKDPWGATLEIPNSPSSGPQGKIYLLSPKTSKFSISTQSPESQHLNQVQVWMRFLKYNPTSTTPQVYFLTICSPGKQKRQIICPPIPTACNTQWWDRRGITIIVMFKDWGGKHRGVTGPLQFWNSARQMLEGPWLGLLSEIILHVFPLCPQCSWFHPLSYLNIFTKKSLLILYHLCLPQPKLQYFCIFLLWKHCESPVKFLGVKPNRQKPHLTMSSG